MKISYLSGATLPSRAANSLHVMKMAQALSNVGNEVILYAPNRKDGFEDGVNDVYRFYGVSQVFKIRKLPWLPLKGRGLFYGAFAGIATLFDGSEIVFGRNLIACYIAASLGKKVVFEIHQPINSRSHFLQKLFIKLTYKKNFFKSLL